MNFKHHLIVTLLFLSIGFPLTSQIFEKNLTWINTDTILSEKALFNGHAVLLFDWNIQSNQITDLGKEVNALTKEFDWLSVVGVHRSSNRIECSVDFMKARIRALDLDFPIQLDTTLSNEKNRGIEFSLYGPEKNVIANKLSFTEANIQNIRQKLLTLREDYNRPGRAMFPVSQTNGLTPLTDLTLLDDPHSICFDSRYGRLNISDTGNDRVVICSEDGKIFMSIGAGTKGATIGEFGETQFDRPMGMAHHKDSSILFIADYGNNRIITADVDRLMTEEFVIKDQDGYDINFPSGPTDLSLEGNELTICLPVSQQVWVINVFSRKLIEEFGTGAGQAAFNKRSSKLTLGNPSSATHFEERLYVIDSETGTTYNMNGSRARALLSRDKVLIDKYGGSLDTTHIYPVRIKEHNGYLYQVDAASGKVLEIDAETSRGYPLNWNKDSLVIGYLTDICWSQDHTYLLDSDQGQVIVLGDGVINYLRFSKLERLRTGPFNTDYFYVGDNIALHPLEQTAITIELTLPEGMMLHPIHKSDVFKSAGSEVYIENRDLKKGPVELIAFPKQEQNQINMMGDIYLSKVGAPWTIYRRRIQISIPVHKDSEGTTKNYSMSMDLTKGLNIND